MKSKNQREKNEETTKSSTAKLVKEIARAERIISAIGDGISIMDRTFKILYQNQFLKRLDAEFSVEMKLHVVMDNYGTHKHPKVQGWLKRHPRFVPHFIPSSSSWLNRIASAGLES